MLYEKALVRFSNGSLQRMEYAAAAAVLQPEKKTVKAMWRIGITCTALTFPLSSFKFE